jgi:hypothetical protein
MIALPAANLSDANSLFIVRKTKESLYLVASIKNEHDLYLLIEL